MKILDLKNAERVGNYIFLTVDISSMGIKVKDVVYKIREEKEGELYIETISGNFFGKDIVNNVTDKKPLDKDSVKAVYGLLGGDKNDDRKVQKQAD